MSAGGFMSMDFSKPPGQGGGGQASNQFFPMLPNLPQTAPQNMSSAPAGSPNTPGIVPPATGGNPPGSGSNTTPFTRDIGGGARSISPLDPNLTGSFFNFLSNNIGKGATPFNLSALLPTGATTTPGQLSAPMDPAMALLFQFLTSGGTQGGLPGQQQLLDLAKGINFMPQYNDIVSAMQRNIDEGQAKLTEQFNVGGGLVGSPYGTAAADYQTQAAKDKSSILSQLALSALPIQQGAASTLAQEGQQQASMFQNLDQASIDRLLQEFIRTRPEYSPLLNAEFGAATTFPPIFQQQTGGGPLSSLGANSGTLAQLAMMIAMGG